MLIKAEIIQVEKGKVFPITELNLNKKFDINFNKFNEHQASHFNHTALTCVVYLLKLEF